jgi:hypothetical protein
MHRRTSGCGTRISISKWAAISWYGATRAGWDSGANSAPIAGPTRSITTSSTSRAYGLRPGLYLDAYTPHRRPDQEERRIYLNLHWPPDEPEPKITLSYDLPGYNEADLWRMLGGQVVAGGATTASGAAQNIASSYLERMLNAQMQDMIIDVETRPSDSEVGSGQALSVALSRYLSPDLYLKYRQGISYSDEREVEVEYRVSNIMLLRSEILRHSATISGSSRRQSTDEINFDVKFRWEY